MRQNHEILWTLFVRVERLDGIAVNRAISLMWNKLEWGRKTVEARVAMTPSSLTPFLCATLRIANDGVRLELIRVPDEECRMKYLKRLASMP